MTEERIQYGADSRKFMLKALRLAAKGAGCTRPNPPVGAVIVKNGRITGSGYHRCAGGPHAEIFAIQAAGNSARSATLYVTLEPCSTRGRTGPCTDAIINSGIKKVIVAALDPNPKHSGKGIGILKKAGIRVHTGLYEDKALQLIHAFGKWITKAVPLLTLKLAISIDGRIADAAGQSKWITGSKSRSIVNSLRKKSDAVMVGIDTVIMDDPGLLPKGPHSSSPYRIIIDSTGRIPLSAKVLTDGRQDRTVIATTSKCSTRKSNLIKKTGAKVITVPSRDGRVCLPELMKILGKLGLLHILCEGGGEIAASLIRNGLADDYYFFIAPVVIGGAASRPAVGGSGWMLKDAPRLSFDRITRAGSDIMLHATPGKQG